MSEAISFSKRIKSPFRYDIVGSFLRPETLKQARAQFAAGKIDRAALTAVEDTEIIKLIKQEEAAGLKAVTDGEFRRSWWHLDFFWGFQGISYKVPEHGYFFHGEETRKATVTVTDKIDGHNHPFVDHFKFTQAHVSKGVQVKQTLPAPAQLLVELLSPTNLPEVRKIYPTDEALFADITKAYKQVITDLYDAGARTIQLDDCTWGMLVATLPKDFINGLAGGEPTTDDELKQLYLNINNSVVDGLPADLTVNTHICRGNYHSTWAAAGGYDKVADPLFNQEHVNAYYLEYDSDRSGSFDPLAKVSDDKLVVLGLLTSKDGKLENRQTVIDRIHEAAKFVPLDRLCLSTQCGFASTEEGNILTSDDQWAKIVLAKSIAKEVWGVDEK
ncbi:5-methyltetrahydropteroyltriglutamate--homocysteine S-methyltransferase [Furfurilactobacillus rossiae]|uniref:Methionine synthase n=1 Tax=Furfurilactobacillus rossiae DSM 15814 TaxID=1114972 RepID=A0A0R1RWK8_9LACO|nr:5-methyltetrahydropteroyltriglutamate--homocysteine S-methyltransferase [Furfurilactobacillus rossiae]KRL57448.1 methionine synthase [Furfurilactobacillus rossiae DSM 15814]QFR65687.1 5-methyltetrahydropteroyltriglutamate--homocysteine S-methyltransferase [Furfurilactobacillus rossiae]QLE61080.1 Methionine synthase II cobalamin-independent [Furfurilactobacillus rossiae]